MAERVPRQVDGPERDLLELSEVSSYLRMSEKTLRRLVRLGRFPRPLEISDGVRVWSWRDVLYWVLLTEIKPRLIPDPPGTPLDTKGHRGTSGPRAKPDS